MLTEKEINDIAEKYYRADIWDFSAFSGNDAFLIKEKIMEIKKREDFANEHWRDLPENDRFGNTNIY